MTDRTVTIRLSAVDEFTPTFDSFAEKLTSADLLTRSAAAAASEAASAYANLAGSMGALPAADAAPATDSAAPTASLDLDSLNAAAGTLALLSDEAADYGGALSLANEAAAALAAEFPAMVEGAGAMRAELKGAETAAGALRDIVAALTAKVNEVRVRLNVDDPRNLLGILGGGISSGLLQIVRDGGGSVPGSDPRAVNGR